MKESNKPADSLYNEALQGGVKQVKTSLYNEEDLKKAFSYYAFKSTSSQPYNQQELDEQFKTFIKTLWKDQDLTS